MTGPATQVGRSRLGADNYIRIGRLRDEASSASSRLEEVEGRWQPAGQVAIETPPVTSSTSYVMVGANLRITMHKGGRCMFSVDGHIGNNQNGSLTQLQMVYGLGDSPPSIAPMSGTPIGLPIKFTTGAPGQMVPFSRTALIEGIVAGNEYWFDIGQLVGSGSSILSDVMFTAFMLIDEITT